MAKYRTEDITVEAFQMTEDRRWNQRDWPIWLVACLKLDGVGCMFTGAYGEYVIDTTDGPKSVRINDWIVRREDTGEVVPIARQEFDEHYERL